MNIAPVNMRMLLMPLIKPIEMNAPRQASSAVPSSERPGAGLTMGCRIDLILQK
jgi:hypothetical protein